MQQSADWLEKLGMSEYAQRFAENKIDVSVLRHLTDQDLKEIGVPLGHRPKILAAVSDLGGTTPVTTEPAAGSEPKAQDTAERRQVTVIFVALLLLPAAHRQRVYTPECRSCSKLQPPPFRQTIGRARMSASRAAASGERASSSAKLPLAAVRPLPPRRGSA